LCASTVDALQADPDRYLCTLLPGFGRRLLTPPQDMLDRAAVTKGLKPVDRAEFRHLSFVDGEDWLWRTPSIQQ
jgi:hypothetical protein